MTLLLSACAKTKTIKNLPQAVTNNAVTLVARQDIELYSFNGLSVGKTWKDINKQAFAYRNNDWIELKTPQKKQAVLASTAVSIGNKIYLIGGYTVDEKGQEKSVAAIYELNTKTDQWHVATHMPVAVDDTVALVYAKRYIYLISGWHDTNNVSAVQVYDTVQNKWFEATAYPAPAVFGQAGGIVENQMIVCDGVKVVVKPKNRNFVASPVCMQGTIDKNKPSHIKWQKISHHSSKAYYRMAAVGDVENNRVVFAGGSDNPYNYNGIGYNGIPATASNLVFSYDLTQNKWHQYDDLIPENMDHRALLKHKSWFYIIGGMDSKQNVLKQVMKFKIPLNQ